MTQVFGLYRGTVVDNNDPQKRMRLKVRVGEFCTGLSDAAIPWAQTACPVYSDPVPVGTIVYVCFEKGNTNYPIYIGYMLKYNKDSQCNTCTKKNGPCQCTQFPNEIPDNYYHNEDVCPYKTPV